jgi:DNA adenine methylase
MEFSRRHGKRPLDATICMADEEMKMIEPLRASISQPIKRHGGKRYLAKRIIDLMPPRAKNPTAPASDDPGWLHYCEPFFGGGAVLLALDPEGISEVANDIDGELTNFFDVLKSPVYFQEFLRLASLTPVSEVEFERADQTSPHSPERALAFFIRNRQSRQALEKDFVAPVRNRTRRGMQDHCSAWLSAIDGLPEMHARLQRVLILNRDALSVIRQQDGARTLFYCDPPYLQSTRTATEAYGKFEMTEADHRKMLDTLASIAGKFLLSGYRNELYDDAAARHCWNRYEFDLPNHAAGGDTKRRMTECVWTNYCGIDKAAAEAYSDVIPTLQARKAEDGSIQSLEDFIQLSLEFD